MHRTASGFVAITLLVCALGDDAWAADKRKKKRGPGDYTSRLKLHEVDVGVEAPDEKEEPKIRELSVPDRASGERGVSADAITPARPQRPSRPLRRDREEGSKNWIILPHEGVEADHVSAADWGWLAESIQEGPDADAPPAAGDEHEPMYEWERETYLSIEGHREGSPEGALPFAPDYEPRTPGNLLEPTDSGDAAGAEGRFKQLEGVLREETIRDLERAVEMHDQLPEGSRVTMEEREQMEYQQPQREESEQEGLRRTRETLSGIVAPTRRGRRARWRGEAEADQALPGMRPTLGTAGASRWNAGLDTSIDVEEAEQETAFFSGAGPSDLGERAGFIAPVRPLSEASPFSGKTEIKPLEPIRPLQPQQPLEERDDDPFGDHEIPGAGFDSIFR